MWALNKINAIAQLLLVLLITSVVSGVEKVTVERVIDGDTFQTSSGDKVRLIGINAPEIQDLYGQDAKDHLAGLIGSLEVELLADRISSDQDIYHRRLRYVILDGTDINKKMIEDGFASAYLKFHFEKSKEYLEAEKSARATSAGAWGKKDQARVEVDHGKRSFNLRTLKLYVVSGLTLLLLCFGVYFYFKK